MYSLGWPQILYLAKGYQKLLVLLPQAPQDWVCRCVLEIDPRASYMLRSPLPTELHPPLGDECL